MADQDGKAACEGTSASGGFDPLVALEELLAPAGLSIADTGGRVSFAGEDPIVPDRIRLGAAVGIPMMAGAVGAAALHRIRTGAGQDLHLDLRQAVHHITPHAFWHPTLNGELPEHALVFDNPFLLDSYRTRDGRTVMASGVYPHLAAKWCRFLDVPPDKDKVAAAFARWDAFELEEAANAVGLPLCVARTAEEWAAHPQGRVLAARPVIGVERISAAPVSGGRLPRHRSDGPVRAPVQRRLVRHLRGRCRRGRGVSGRGREPSLVGGSPRATSGAGARAARPADSSDPGAGSGN